MNNYSQLYFGKDLESLEYQDILDYFVEEKEESENIEFKAYHNQYGSFNKNLEGVIRGVCAFLNSNGGILIWGAPLGQKDGERTIYKGDLSFVSELINKDSLISKISDSITPLPTNVNVKIIEHENQFLYIFETQVSNYSPHQFKNTYWARLDGQTKPAPHYLIDALFKKISYPNIEGFINIDSFGNYGRDKVFIEISIIIINFSELQNEYDITYNVICPEAKFEGSFMPHLARFYGADGHQYKNNESIKILHFGAPEITTQKLIFNIHELAEKHNHKMNILMFFGGKKSPLKLSEYKLNFGITGIPAKDPTILIEECYENVLSAEKQKKHGTTKENLLKRLLKR